MYGTSIVSLKAVVLNNLELLKYTLGCMRLQRDHLGYMSIVLADLPLMCGFIMIQVYVHVLHLKIVGDNYYMIVLKALLQGGA